MSNPLPEPYGRVTVHSITGQHFFYRDPEPPYMDTAKECIVVYSSDAVHAHAAAEVAAARDCRTCWHHRVEDRHIQTMGHVLCVDQLCANADRYEALPPVRLWRESK